MPLIFVMNDNNIDIYVEEQEKDGKRIKCEISVIRYFSTVFELFCVRKCIRLRVME